MPKRKSKKDDSNSLDLLLAAMGSLDNESTEENEEVESSAKKAKVTEEKEGDIELAGQLTQVDQVSDSYAKQPKKGKGGAKSKAQRKAEEELVNESVEPFIADYEKLLETDKSSTEPKQIYKQLIEIIGCCNISMLNIMLTKVDAERIKQAFVGNFGPSLFEKLNLVKNHNFFTILFDFLKTHSDATSKKELADTITNRNINEMITLGFGQRLKSLFEEFPTSVALLNYVSGTAQKTYLHNCAQANLILLIPILLKHININAIDRNGQTALHFAAKYARQNCVEALLKEGIDHTIKDSKGLTAFEVIKSTNIKKANHLIAIFNQHTKTMKPPIKARAPIPSTSIDLVVASIAKNAIAALEQAKQPLAPIAAAPLIQEVKPAAAPLIPEAQPAPAPFNPADYLSNLTPEQLSMVKALLLEKTAKPEPVKAPVIDMAEKAAPAAKPALLFSKFNPVNFLSDLAEEQVENTAEAGLSCKG